MSFDAIVGGILTSLIAAGIAAAIVCLWRRRSKGRPSPVEEDRVPAVAAPPTTPPPAPPPRLGELDAEGYPSYLQIPTGPHVFLPYPTPMNAAHEIAQIAAPLSRERYVRDTFIERWVRWTGIVSNVSEEDRVYRVATRSAYGRSGGLLVLMFPLTRRPKLKFSAKVKSSLTKGRFGERAKTDFH